MIDHCFGAGIAIREKTIRDVLRHQRKLSRVGVGF